MNISVVSIDLESFTTIFLASNYGQYKRYSNNDGITPTTNSILFPLIKVKQIFKVEHIEDIS